MDSAELEQAIREGVKMSFVAEPIFWGGLLSQNSTMLVGKANPVAVWVSLQDGVVKGIPHPRSRVLIRSTQVKNQSEFRERKAAKWQFPVDKIVSEIVHRIQLEFLSKSSTSDRQQKVITSRQDARRLAAHFDLTFPRNASVRESVAALDDGPFSVAIKTSREGDLRLEFEGLTGSEAQQLLTEAKRLKLLPAFKRSSDEDTKTAWDHLTA